MKLFLRFLLIFAVLAAGSYYLVLGRYHQPFPHPLGPQLDDYVRTDYIADMSRTSTKLVLVGDSVLLDGVDPDQFEKIFGQKIYFMAFPGSSSAQWYLLLKNSIIKANPRPETVVILFRDTALTTPDFRVTGQYLAQIDENAKADDTELLNRAYIWPVGPVEQVFSRYFPLYSDRAYLRTKVDSRLKYTLPARLFGCSSKCVETAIWETFSSDMMNSAVMGVAVGEAENHLYTLGTMNFKAQVDKSFLPLIINLARKNHIRLILAQARTRDSMNASSQPALLSAYTRDLERYLKDQGVTYLSFTNEARVPSNDFKDVIHMTSAGRKIFTPIFAEAIRSLIEGTAGAKP